jgi:hypothetical protein
MANQETYITLCPPAPGDRFSAPLLATPKDFSLTKGGHIKFHGKLMTAPELLKLFTLEQLAPELGLTASFNAANNMIDLTLKHKPTEQDLSDHITIPPKVLKQAGLEKGTIVIRGCGDHLDMGMGTRKPPKQGAKNFKFDDAWRNFTKHLEP